MNILDFSIKPFTKKLRQEFLHSYNFGVKNNPFKGYNAIDIIDIPGLGCRLYYPTFLMFIISTNSDLTQIEGRIHINLIERFYLWGAIRDKLMEIYNIKIKNGSD